MHKRQAFPDKENRFGADYAVKDDWRAAMRNDVDFKTDYRKDYALKEDLYTGDKHSRALRFLDPNLDLQRYETRARPFPYGMR